MNPYAVIVSFSTLCSTASVTILVIYIAILITP